MQKSRCNRQALAITTSFMLTLAACDGGALGLVRDIEAARGECGAAELRRSDESCVRMMEEYATLGTELVHSYLGGLRALDRALERMPPPVFDTVGFGRAVNPALLPGVGPEGPMSGLRPVPPLPPSAASALNAPMGGTFLQRRGDRTSAARSLVDPADRRTRDSVASRSRAAPFGYARDQWGIIPLDPYGASWNRESRGYRAYRTLPPGSPLAGSYGYGYGAYAPGGGSYGYEPYSRGGTAYGLGPYDRGGMGYGYDPYLRGDAGYGYGPYDRGAMGYGYDPYSRGDAGYGYGPYDRGGMGYGYDPYLRGDAGYGYGPYDRGGRGYGYDPYDTHQYGYAPSYDYRAGQDRLRYEQDVYRDYGARGNYADGYGPGSPNEYGRYPGDAYDARSPEQAWDYQPGESDAGPAGIPPAAVAPPRHAPGVLLPPGERLRRPWLDD